ncbi:Peroxidase, family 2-domain-containing protein [Mycena alexandri]|uniref:Peroxidase, family 2-domain-containing protein n=1 Tax=Mycena alexandri TaxID=1745969 RepID=A0AAD6SMZ0_9AGAR|nr:Peroxidase, family 2-domain-containing protein [Mycena alexandri]
MQLQFSSLVIASVFFATQTAATPGHANKYQWIAPTATDLRGPCPGLNTLANHGYLPRDGRNVTVPGIMDAALAAFNVNWDAILIAAKFGLLTGDDLLSGTQMTLAALSSHNIVEHDASISRNDFGDGSGDNVHFNETTFSTLANSNPGKDTYDTTSAGLVQKQRLADSVANNPLLVNTAKEFILRSRESGLYLSIFGDPATGIAPKKFVNIFFREERLPIAEGWTKSKSLITGDSLGIIEENIHNVSDWTATTSCEPLVLGPNGPIL